MLAGLLQSGQYAAGGLEVMAEQYAVPSPAIPTQWNAGAPLNVDPEEEHTDLQAFLRSAPEFLDMDLLRRALEHSSAVCMVGIAEAQSYGTGVLIDRDLVLTNFHTLKVNNEDIEAVINDVSIRFGFIGTAAGQLLELSSQPIVASSRTQELDFVILKLKEPCKTIAPLSPSNGRNEYPPGAAIHILQHPGGGSMKLSVSNNGVVKTFQDKGLLHYVTITAGGSSGAPCFDEQWNLIAIHRAEKATTFGSIREGILMNSIVTAAGL